MEPYLQRLARECWQGGIEPRLANTRGDPTAYLTVPLVGPLATMHRLPSSLSSSFVSPPPAILRGGPNALLPTAASARPPATGGARIAKSVARAFAPTDSARARARQVADERTRAADGERAGACVFVSSHARPRLFPPNFTRARRHRVPRQPHSHGGPTAHERPYARSRLAPIASHTCYF